MKKREKPQQEESKKLTEENREWIAWRKAKKDGRLTEHRKMLKSSAYRKMQKSIQAREDKTRTK